MSPLPLVISDYETDVVIQASLRKELGFDVSAITIAYRLRIIMDSDKIVSEIPPFHLEQRSVSWFNARQMVLDAGRSVKLDSPKAVLQEEKSFFFSLVNESSDKEVPYAIAEGKTE